MRESREKLTKIFFIFFVIFLIFSYAFIIISLDHNCIGHDCNICYEIKLIKDILDSLLILFLVFRVIDSFKYYFDKIRYFKKKWRFLTPIRLKVELLE